MHAVNGHDAYLLLDELPEVFLHTLKVAIIDPASAQQEINFDRFKLNIGKSSKYVSGLEFTELL